MFDVVHHFFTDNPGVPHWWPGLCLAFDALRCIPGRAADTASWPVRVPSLSGRRGASRTLSQNARNDGHRASGGGTSKGLQGVDPARVQVQNLTRVGDL